MTARAPLLAAVLLGLSAILPCPKVAGQEPPVKLPEEYTAFAVNLGNVGSTVPTPLDIRITRWTTAAEMETLMTALRGKGPDALRNAMQKMPSVGTISTPGSLAYHFRYSNQEMTKNGLRRIILMTDRPIDAWEAMNRPYSIEYPFASIEMMVDSSGRGRGTLSIATKLVVLDNLLIVEGLADRPVDLNNVRRR